MIDFPAPLSPVSAFRFSPNSIVRSAIRAKSLIRTLASTGYSAPRFGRRISAGIDQRILLASTGKK